jgi:DEAD/DEAH box helicase domain-containing protein
MLTDIIGSLRRDPEFSERVTHWEVVPARDGTYADIPSGVDPRIRAALISRGIERIYSHQLAAWNEVRAGRSVVLVSPTASGKTPRSTLARTTSVKLAPAATFLSSAVS